MSTHRRISQVLSMFVILTVLFSSFGLSSTSAQGSDGIERQVNPQTGKVSFITPESGGALPASKALGSSARPQDPAMALVKRFGSEFGLDTPERDLSEKKTKHTGDGRITAYYQQNYGGIPVLGGELIVNTNENGDLYSINGEVLTNISITTEPTITLEQAQQTALQAAAKWYGETSDDFLASEPTLWIYNESLLRPSTRPAELVWRMEVTPKELGMPVRELVLVNAQRGGISLHFNQIDTAWGETKKDPKSNSDRPTSNSSSNPMVVQIGSTLYVATTGNDSNSCSSADSPCATINGAIGKAAAGDTIQVAMGTYTGTGTEVVLINKNITLSGGWDASFTTQGGTSIIDGQASRRGMTVNLNISATIENFTIQNGNMDCCQEGGGGIYNLGNLIVISSKINNNSAYRGGGINNRGILTINNGTVSNNVTTGYNQAGGGIANSMYNLGSGILTLNNSTVNGNSSSRAGGIFNGHTAILNNSTISGNFSLGGGGVYTEVALTINNSTIVNNRDFGGSNGGGGIYHYEGNISIQNSIIAHNSSWWGPDCLSNTFGAGTLIISNGYNLIGDNSNCNVSSTTGDLIGTSTNPIDPRLAPLQDNGGSTFTHALIVGSPAIGAGNPATPGNGGNACLATDQREIARPVNIRCDIGAYEGSVPWTLAPFAQTYTAHQYTSLPGDFLCDQSDPTCAAGDEHAQSAHAYAIGTYDLYAAQYGRDSLDNQGMTIISTVHYSSGYNNANWNAEQLVYGDASGWPLADDVVAHEFTHGVTQYESNLFYYYQSGAINESFSDLWGEYYDQSNGLGNDSPSVKWQIGEDVTGQGAIRSMSNPPAFGDPDKMSSANYYEGEGDSGGVHTNSGVNNKAIYLMVDGGTFNGKTVTALGWEKTAAIYYEVNTNLLSSGADYSDLYYALRQACTNLIGQKGITSGDCVEVKDAIDAVEMNIQPAPNFNSEAPYCNAGSPVTTVLTDGLEAGTGNWTFSNGPHPRWQLDSLYGPYAQSGLHSLYADDYPDVVTDAAARLTSFTVPGNAFLRFAHAYGFESGYNLGDPTFYHFDGGVLEYSTNNGTTWVDAGSLIDYNGYRGTIFTGAGNPLSGRSAFAGDSHGYISTRLNLYSLAGQTVSFRWRMGLDEYGYDWGWWVDNIQVHTCPVVLHRDSVGVFRPSNGALYLKNSNATGFADVQINYGQGGDYPVVGDWDGDGDVTIGIYRNGTFYLRNANTIGFADIVFPFGAPGDQPVAGDWNNDGIDTIGVYRPSSGTFFLHNSNSAGAPSAIFALGVAGDVGIAGDWNGDGIDTTGVFRPSNGALYLKNTNATGFADIQINYGLPGDRPVTGDWDNNGTDTIGIYRNGTFYLRNSNTIGFADIVFGLGVQGDMPIAGDWDKKP